MRMHRLASAGVFLLLPLVAAGMQYSRSGSSPVDAQVEALKKLAVLDGEWRGPAWILAPSGERQDLTQTERVGPFLGGAVRVVEGRGFDAGGNVVFNALGVFSFDPATKEYTMRSYAMGRAGDHPLTVTDEGFSWEIDAGPMTIRYHATVKDGIWREVGDRIADGQDPVRFFEMTLTRVGDTDWPAGGALGPE